LEDEARIAKLRIIFEKEGFTTARGKLLKTFRQTLAHRLPGGRSYSRLKVSEEAISKGSPSKSESFEDDVVLDYLKANVVYFKRRPGLDYPEPYNHPDLRGKFPNQKIPLNLLEKNERNPLMWRCEENMIRYFHNPGNNMSWIEVGYTTSFIWLSSQIYGI
jgi:hypothetical protein